MAHRIQHRLPSVPITVMQLTVDTRRVLLVELVRAGTLSALLAENTELRSART